MKDVIIGLFGEYDYTLGTTIAGLDFVWLAGVIFVAIFLLGFFSLARIVLKACLGD